MSIPSGHKKFTWSRDYSIMDPAPSIRVATAKEAQKVLDNMVKSMPVMDDVLEEVKKDQGDNIEITSYKIGRDYYYASPHLIRITVSGHRPMTQEEMDNQRKRQSTAAKRRAAEKTAKRKELEATVLKEIKKDPELAQILKAKLEGN